MSLIEILVAFSLATLVILPIFLIFGMSEKVTFKTTNEIVATNLAMQKLEELKSRPFAQLRTLVEGHAVDPDGPFAEIALPIERDQAWNTAGVTYERESRVSFFPFPNPDPGDPEYELQKRRVRIRTIIRFTEQIGGRSVVRNFELATVVGDEQYGAGLVASFSLPGAPKP